MLQTKKFLPPNMANFFPINLWGIGDTFSRGLPKNGV